MDAVMELEIGPGPEPGSYVVRVLRSVGGGEPTETIMLDLDALVDQRPHLEASVLSSSVAARRVMSDTEAVIQDVGRRLFDSAFSGSIASAYRTSMAVASERGKGVQIALRLTAPGLAALPWEALYDSETQTYLCRKEPLVRNVPAPYSPGALVVAPPLRVLGMISSPRGLPALDIDDERERLENALKPHLASGRVELHWLEDASWDGVHGKLLEQEWHVLHFIGHGGYDTETDEGVLAFVGRDGRADYVAASSLADLLDEAEPTPRLVVLNSCQSGAAGTSDLFSGTAAALAHSGIRAVAAMQFSISDVAAIAFARGFYTALAYGRGIDEAVRSGRIGILGIGRGTLEWVTPVLYLRGEDAHLFDVAPMAPARSAVTGPVAGPIPIIHTGTSRDAAPRPAPPRTPAAAVPPPVTAPKQAPEAIVPPTAATSTTVPARAAPPASPATPPAPPQRPTPAASEPPTHPRKRKAKPWLVVGIIAVLALGAGLTSVLLLNPGILGMTGSGDDGGETPDDSGGFTTTAVELTVPMDQQWTATGVSCAAGDTLDITASGTAFHGVDPSSEVGPEGLGDPFFHQWNVPGLPDANTASLIGGLDTMPDEPFYVGSGTSYTCPVDGSFLLGINDIGLGGNSGGFQAVVTHTPSG